ncbi:hypothetical protein E2C01_079729 [Portunus trituberculatus]|uniref:Uncharacterized protein n=1 Tax=Portunus trituberculatus TaxID=210409 RepID=A0A5B7IXS5_PORTR|nr:hypothetical protein [Portunus trituberculatus]
MLNEASNSNVMVSAQLRDTPPPLQPPPCLSSTSGAQMAAAATHATIPRTTHCSSLLAARQA